MSEARSIVVKVQLHAIRDESDTSVAANRFSFTFAGEAAPTVSELVASWADNTFSQTYTRTVNDDLLKQLAHTSLLRVCAEVQHKPDDAAPAPEFAALPHSYFLDLSALLFNEKSVESAWRRDAGQAYLPYVRAPPGITELRVTVSVEDVLMSEAELDRWTPIKIVLDHLATLPLPEKCPTFEVAAERYAPVYCKYRFFDSERTYIGPPRPHAADVAVAFSKVFLLPAAHHKYDLTYGPPRASFAATGITDSAAAAASEAEAAPPIEGGAPAGMTSVFAPTATLSATASTADPFYATLSGTMAFAPRRSAGARAASGLDAQGLARMWDGYDEMAVEECVSGMEEGPLRVECHDRDPRGSLTDALILGHQHDEAAAAAAAVAAAASAVAVATGAPEALTSPKASSEALTYLYGVAAFSLLDLCGGSTVIRARAPVLPVFPTTFLSAASMSRAPPASLAITSAPVAPPSGPADPYSIQVPLDPYTAVNTQLTLTATALQPPEIARLGADGGGGRRALPTPAQIDHKFARAIFVLRYDDDARLQPLLAAIADANARAMHMEHLPRRSLVNVQLSEEQKSDRSTLDIVTGFTVIDPEFRIVCIEGLKHGTAIPSIYRALPRTVAHSDDGSVLLQNSSLSFRHRLYTAFNLELKAVKLTKPLAAILKDSTMYTRSHIPDECYRALERLGKLRKCDRLAAVKSGDLFVRVAQFLALEKRFGGFVSDEDIDGGAGALQATDSPAVRFAGRPKSHGGATTATAATAAGASPSALKSSASAAALPLSSTSSSSAAATNAHASSSGEQHHARRKAATDASNAAFEAHQAARATQNPTDFIAKHIADHTVRFRREREVGPPPPDGQLFLYSGQRRNYRDWAMGELRKRVTSDANAHCYTYGAEFNSLTFPATDEREERAKELEKSKKINSERFKSSLYLPPHHVYEHPYKPSAYRSEELQLPYKENPSGNPLDNVRVPRAEVEYFRSRGQPMFNTIPQRGSVEFGAPGNPDWGVSVFAEGGDGVEAAKQAAAAAAKAQWKAKMVVDSPVVHVYARGTYRTAPAQTDRLQGLLHDPPVKSSVKYPAHLKVEPPPITIHTDPYDPKAKTVLGRTTEPDKFVEPGVHFRIPGKARVLPENKHTRRSVTDLHAHEYAHAAFRGTPVSTYE